MTAITLVHSPAEHPHLRRLDVNRDLRPVADLVELCFGDQLDPDGRRYISQMRSAAGNTRYLNWISRIGERLPYPMTGYVWEQEGQIIGNLSLIPFTQKGTPIFLIANVAVHPGYRHRGIARTMTSAGLNFARARRAGAVWLQANEDNAIAVHLYRSMGFTVKARRTTWLRQEGNPPPLAVQNLQIMPRRAHHWNQQKTWLNQLHPPELRWHLPLNLNLLRPGLWGFLARIFSEAYPLQWAVEQKGELLGVLTWQRSPAFADRLWLAANSSDDSAAAMALIPYVCRRLPGHRPLNLEYPAGRAVEALHATGFQAHRTLLWMTICVR